MSISPARSDPRAVEVQIADDELSVKLSDGRKIVVPLAWFPRLLNASSSERNHWELLGNGAGIHWPDVDEDLSVSGLLRGIPAVEYRRSA